MKENRSRECRGETVMRSLRVVAFHAEPEERCSKFKVFKIRTPNQNTIRNPDYDEIRILLLTR